MDQKRRFYSGVPNHCYQNTKNGFLLFYTISDYLVYFTTVCIYAQKHHVKVTSLCLMPDHSHSNLLANSSTKLSAYYRDVSSAYAQSEELTGNDIFIIFNRPFGSAPKKGDKMIRTNFIYIGNNPVERKLCSKAAEYRWNFLAYAKSDHPFSKKLVIRRASWQMKKAIKEIKGVHSRLRPLTHRQIKRLAAGLNHEERLQLIDFIIATYSVIDYEYSIRYFGGYDKMLKAMEYNTGSEYDVNEVFVGKSDACYSQIAKWLISNLHLNDIHEVFKMPEKERKDLMWMIHYELGINLKQLAKYMRILL